MSFSEETTHIFHLLTSFMESLDLQPSDYESSMEYLRDLLRTQDVDGKTLVHHICSNCPTTTSLYLLNLVLVFGSPTSIQDMEGNTPLSALLLWCTDPLLRLEMVKSLLWAGADPNLCPSEGLTPLMTAVVLDDCSLVELLLEHGADVNIRFWTHAPFLVPNNSSALSLAANKMQWPICLALLQSEQLSEEVQFHANLHADSETKHLFHAYIQSKHTDM